MIKLLNFTIKVIASFLVLYIFGINLIIVILFWDGKYMVTTEIIDMIWGFTDEENYKNK